MVMPNDRYNGCWFLLFAWFVALFAFGELIRFLWGWILTR